MELVHFQITRNCNLRCPFCGQWGRKGFFSDAAGQALSLAEWKALAQELKDSYAPLPHILLWGGEPLVCPFFDELTAYLHALGFTLGLVTNGTLIDRHLALCRTAFKVIYVSIDGPRTVHDQIRGQGTFDKICSNVKLLNGADVKTIVMSVLSPLLLDHLAAFPQTVAHLGADELYLQDYIRLSADEADAYKAWLKNSFGMDAPGIDAWVQALPADYEQKKRQALLNLKRHTYGLPVVYLPHMPDGAPCCSPGRHVHVAWNGEVLYCTDFYDFSAGNVRQDSLSALYNNQKSQRFREELAQNPTCAHCSWRGKQHFYL